MSEFSGAQWCARYPTSVSLTDLVAPFRAGVAAFIEAMRAGGASVQVSATYRPPERAYLMHWCCLIGSGGQDPAEIPPMAGVDINWSHGGDVVAAKAAAREMMKGYNIAYPAALVSRHTQRRAIDMTIRFSGAISVRNRSGALCAVAALGDLYAIGASYGVRKLISDQPHWSDDGH